MRKFQIQELRKKFQKILQRVKFAVVGIWLMLCFSNCSEFVAPNNDSQSVVENKSQHQMSLSFTRIESSGLSPFKVEVTLKEGGQYLKGQKLQLNIPFGSVSPIVENQDGSYQFTVTPSLSGVYPVEVTFKEKTIRRDAIVLNKVASGAGQPLAVPGNYVNTPGWEDGITITPDGNYLFVQYGPFRMMGLAAISSICASGSYSAYDLVNCQGKPDSNWIFETLGPFTEPLRPRFPTGVIQGTQLTHSPLVIPGVANGLAIFPTVFYGFKRQEDGTFAEPFKVAFNDVKGANGPFGLSFQMTSSTTANFAVSWSNYFNDLGGDGKPDIFSGTMTMGMDKSLGDVTYSGETYASISPNVTPLSFSSHSGVQGNPHLYYDNAGKVQSIWTDDEQVTNDLSVYRLTSGTFPNGSWQKVALPSKVNTTSNESQPFFNGKKLYLNRDTKIVYHEYLGNGGADYGLNTSWGDEVVVLEAGNTAIGSIYGIGEPTIAEFQGKTILYFVYIKVRGAGAVVGRFDLDLGAGFVELP